jgi:phosphoglycolate phosphatase
MIKLLAFDIDNTLAAINKPIPDTVVEELKTFENQGIKIAFVSGKPAIYIAGMVRQVGLKDPIIIGENGLSIYYGCAVPPQKLIENNTSSETNRLLLKIKHVLQDQFGPSIWFQPNVAAVTAFPTDPSRMNELIELVDKLFDDQNVNQHLFHYKHSDSIDITPKNINKGTAIKKLLQQEVIDREEVIAIGDGENDIPMFKEARLALGVNFQGDYSVDKNFRTIAEAISYVKQRDGSLASF